MINYLGGLKKKFEYVMTNRESDEREFEPAMYILHERKLGRSFIVPLQAFYKYLDPKDNAAALVSDKKEFENKVNQTQTALRLGLPNSPLKEQAKDDMVDLTLALALHDVTGILPCVCFNLSKCLRMFDIEVRPEAAIQLHLFIQDGIETLKNMPPAEPDKELPCGDVTLYVDGHKLSSQDLTVKESDLVIESNEEGEA